MRVHTDIGELDKHPAVRQGLVSEMVMEHFEHARNAGNLVDPSGEGWAGAVETSRFMRIQIRVVGKRVQAATFATYGCVPAIACGSFITEWVHRRTLDEALAFTPRQLRKALGGLPEGRGYCADLAVDALHAAIRDAQQRERNGPDA